MAKRSVYQDFVTALKKHWRVAFPSIRPVERSLGPTMPKASTFYAGVAKPSGLRVYLNFQHSRLAWNVGQFTINVILTQREGEPQIRSSTATPEDPASLTEGSYRIGFLLGRKDKWWHLKDDNPPPLTEAWRPTSYGDVDAVIREAVADVSGQVQALLDKLNITMTLEPPLQAEQ